MATAFYFQIAAEDRCHLNGLALREGEARYVTLVSQSDVAEGWRAHRSNGGIIMDVTTNDIVYENLSMPHSPRWHQDKLWLLESGTGYLGYIDEKAGQFERVAFCPGYARGLSFINHYAIVATSEGRENKTFQGLALDETLNQKQAQGRCGLHVIDLNTGDRVHGLNVEGLVKELYDVVVLPGISQPRAVGIRNQELCYMLKIPSQEVRNQQHDNR